MYTSLLVFLPEFAIYLPSSHAGYMSCYFNKKWHKDLKKMLGSNWLTAILWLFKTSDSIRLKTRSHILKYFQHHRCENPKFHKFWNCYLIQLLAGSLKKEKKTHQSLSENFIFLGPQGYVANTLTVISRREGGSTYQKGRKNGVMVRVSTLKRKYMWQNIDGMNTQHSSAALSRSHSVMDR